MGILDRFKRITEADKKKVIKTSITDGKGIVVRGGILFQKIDNLPQEADKQLLYKNAYERFGIVAKIIDATTEQTVQNFSFDGPSKEKLEKLRRKLNFDTFLHLNCKTGLKTGNFFCEVVGSLTDPTKLKPLPPEQMVVVRKNTGKVIAYIQDTGTNKLVWGKVDKRYSEFQSGEFKEVGKKERILHFTFNLQAGEKYGTSLIEPAIRMLRIKDSIEGNIPVILQRYLAPIVHVSVGDEDAEPTRAQLVEMHADFKDIYSDTEYITDFRTKMEVLGFKDTGVMNIKDIVEIIDKDIMMAMGMYPVLAGKGDAGDGKAAEVQLRAESRHIKAIQRDLKTQFEDKFIIGLGIGTEEDILIWERTDEREEVEHVANVVQLYGAGLLTRQKANDLLPKDFRETLPDGGAVGGQMTGETSSDTSNPKVNDNPQDPTKSTRMVSGQRVKKDDHRNPLSKKIKKTNKSEREVTRK